MSAVSRVKIMLDALVGKSIPGIRVGVIVLRYAQSRGFRSEGKTNEEVAQFFLDELKRNIRSVVISRAIGDVHRANKVAADSAETDANIDFD